MTVRAKQAKLFIVAVVLAVAAAGGCGGQRSRSSSGLPSATAPDLVRVRGALTQDPGGTYELTADGNRRYRMTMLTGELAGQYWVWDGKTVLGYDPHGDPKYQRIENPTKEESPAANFYRPGTEEFKQLCPMGKRLGTKTLFGRTAVRYQCEEVETGDETPDAGELALDEKTGLVLESPPSDGEVITGVGFGPAIAADTFSTALPPDANPSAATPEGESTDAPQYGGDVGSKIGDFRLNAVGGGLVDSTSYRGKPFVIVAGTADEIRSTLRRLLPMTRAGKPPVVGLLQVLPPGDWNGSLLNPTDVDQLAPSISKSVGTFAVPVGIDVTGTATGKLGADFPVPGYPTQVTIALIASNGKIAQRTTATETDATLRTWIAALS